MPMHMRGGESWRPGGSPRPPPPLHAPGTRGCGRVRWHSDCAHTTDATDACDDERRYKEMGFEWGRGRVHLRGPPALSNALENPTIPCNHAHRYSLGVTHHDIVSVGMQSVRMPQMQQMVSAGEKRWALRVGQGKGAPGRGSCAFEHPL
jgi:hypothetical protein